MRVTLTVNETVEIHLHLLRHGYLDCWYSRDEDKGDGEEGQREMKEMLTRTRRNRGNLLCLIDDYDCYY